MANTPAVKLAPQPAPPEELKTVSELTLPKRRKLRHLMLKLSFLLLVVVPVAISAAYLYLRAADQYHSDAAFSVRSEEAQNPLDIMGAFTQSAGSSAPDSEILNDFILSQTLVQIVDERLGLSGIYNKHQEDIIFSLGEERSIEDKLDYWARMVSLAIDTNSGVLEIQVRAFTPEEAHMVATEIIDRSAELVEDLSRIAREDAMRFTLQDVEKAEERLKDIRTKVRAFRTQYQIIDPEADVESQVGIVAALQAQLAESLIELQTIDSNSQGTDPRLPSIQRRVDAIREQIANERNSVSNQSPDGKSLSELIGEYEELLVDLEFAQNAYVAALAAEEQARIEANRRARYLAVHIPPTLAEDSLYPLRELLLLVIFACCFAAWSILVMIYYNIRDRR